MDTHELKQTDADAAETPSLREYHVSEDFNTRLLNRIADERYAEVRSSAYLPKPAPHFTFAQAAPAFAAFALVAFVAVNALQEFPVADSNPAKTTSLAAANSVPEPLGKTIGLTDEYMTAEPIDNPTYAGAEQSSAHRAGVANGASLVNATNNSYRYTSPRQWYLDRELKRAQRYNQISSSLGSGHQYFQIIQRSYFQVAPNVIVGTTTLRYGTLNPSQSAPQIIIHQSPAESISPSAPGSTGRPALGGSF